MLRFDRLTALMSRFNLTVRAADLSDATLAVTSDRAGGLEKVFFRSAGSGFALAPERVVFSAVADWGGPANPLMAALPDVAELDIAGDVESATLVGLMQAELAAQRCGSESAVSRLGEVLVIRLMRARIEEGSTQPGLLAGLSDPRLSRAIVAIHERPDKEWRNGDLAQIAGFSVSRFTEMFRLRMGETPAAYLRRWRMTLARRDVSRGDRIDTVARRYGYGSPEGFARAFKRHFGENPMALRSGLRGKAAALPRHVVPPTWQAG